MKCQNCDFLPHDRDIFCRKCGCELPQEEKFTCECGSEVLEEDNFCHHCGASFQEAFCACGGTLPQGANYCPTCGTPIEKLEETAGEKEVEEVFEDEVGQDSGSFSKSPEPSSDSSNAYKA